jgi:hypothetical protein
LARPRRFSRISGQQNTISETTVNLAVAPSQALFYWLLTKHIPMREALSTAWQASPAAQLHDLKLLSLSALFGRLR